MIVPLAHLVQTGFGDFYDGVAHLAVTPSDLLLVLGLGLLAGLRGAATARAVLVALPLAWLCGGLIGSRWPAGGSALAMATTLSFGLAGALVALDRRLPRAAVVAVAGGAGLLHGYVHGATMAQAGMGGIVLFGAVAAVFVASTLVPAAVVGLQAGWARIAVRVVGSWIAASGLLMLGWLARGKGGIS